MAKDLILGNGFDRDFCLALERRLVGAVSRPLVNVMVEGGLSKLDEQFGEKIVGLLFEIECSLIEYGMSKRKKEQTNPQHVKIF